MTTSSKESFMSKQVKVNVDMAINKAAKVAVAKGSASSVKGFYESAIESAAMEFFDECARLEGIPLNEWLSQMGRGEF